MVVIAVMILGAFFGIQGWLYAMIASAIVIIIATTIDYLLSNCMGREIPIREVFDYFAADWLWTMIIFYFAAGLLVITLSALIAS